MRGSLMLKTDSYKVTHWRQYPPGTTGVYSYMESRGGRWSTSVFFGLQYLLREYVVGPVVTRSGIEEADETVDPNIRTTQDGQLVTQGENREKQVSTRRQGLSECSNHQNGGTHRLKNGLGPRSGQRVCPDSILARDSTNSDPVYFVGPGVKQTGADA
jgi:nicotinamide phosphoribosyltransferase-like protein